MIASVNNSRALGDGHGLEPKLAPSKAISSITLSLLRRWPGTIIALRMLSAAEKRGPKFSPLQTSSLRALSLIAVASTSEKKNQIGRLFSVSVMMNPISYNDCYHNKTNYRLQM